MEGLKEVATQVLAPHFHSGQKGVKFAIRVTSRHHNTLGRLDIINEVARTVGPDHNVDLKKYDVLILIEVYKVRFESGFEEWLLMRVEYLRYERCEGFREVPEVQHAGAAGERVAGRDGDDREEG